ncbi:hypothetical protein [Achromobacter sp. UBA2119]|uniref:hypothetical protein n=1 Tax=Achromobacter sp. UBA2119 TaxID=1945911 RepID=UPI00257FBF6C|nr:hypothetical protein [Achromobacter sp. UBA2119]
MSSLQRIRWVRERLDRWGAWQLVGTSRTGASVLGRLSDAAAKGGRKRSTVPFDDIECGLTDRAVAQLPKELKSAVSTWHTEEGTLEGIAELLGVSKITLQRRLAHADRRIEEWFRARKAHAERVAVTIGIR